MAHSPKPAGPAPSRTHLHEAALRHLSRFAATEMGLVRVLDRRVQRWARAATAEGQSVEGAVPAALATVRQVAAALVQAGVLNDAGFAAARATRLARSGRSRAAVAAHLAAKGVPQEIAQTVLPDAAAELPSALAYLRRRRIGPFRAVADPELHVRDLAALGRAGFSREIASRALAMSRDQAETLVLEFKRG